MTKKLPDCPKCGEDELWLWRTGDSFRVRCYLCGWDSDDVVLAIGQELPDVVDETVKAAQEYFNEDESA